MKRIGIAVASVVLAMTGLAALAAGPAAVRKQLEASMLVTGTIAVDNAGKVISYAFDDKEKLPVGVVEMLDRRVPAWTFEPVIVDGKPASVRTYMSIRLVAKKLDKDNYAISIRSASFGHPDGSSRAKRVQEAIKAVQASNEQPKVCKNEGLTPPNYPDAGALFGVQANVYLLVKASPDGQVQDVIAEQVNMKVVTDERNMERWRNLFADAAVKQARKWCVEPPADDTDAKYGFHVARVPVRFYLTREPPRYGEWEGYVPGPRQSNPWQADSEGKGFSPDTLMPGRAYIAGTGLKLLSELSDS
jgi:hypothetical protein